MKRKAKSPDKPEEEKAPERKAKRTTTEEIKEDSGKKKSVDTKEPKKSSSPKKESSPAKSLLNKDSPFASITDSTTEFEAIFDALAEEVINNYVLMVCGTPLRFREIEFYVNHPNHPDTYTHSDEDQKRASCWYFHKIGKTFRGGTYKGLDVSIGGKNYYGGMLIRSLFDRNTGGIIEGSCLCVDYIIKLVKAKHPKLGEIKDIVADSNYSEDVLDKNSIIHLEKAGPSDVKYKYYKGPRVGLSAKYPKYLNKLYRYVVLPAKIKKGKDTLIKALLEQGISKREVQTLTGATLALIEKTAAS